MRKFLGVSLHKPLRLNAHNWDHKFVKKVALSMFSKNKTSDAKFSALNRAQAIIEFKTDGTIIDDNENFLAALGYEKSEIVGKHHKMFVRENERNHQDYQKFWEACAMENSNQVNFAA